LKDHGAPPSLAIEARRTVEQEALVQHCRALERQARALLKDLESHHIADRQWLAIGRTHLAIGCMCLVRAVTRQDFF